MVSAGPDRSLQKVIGMPAKRGASASVSLDASPTKTKVARVNAAAEDLARAAGSGKADPSCTVPGTHTHGV